MKYVDEYREAEAVRCIARRIGRAVTRPWTIMEVCGGQTHTIVRYGIDELLPANVTLVHGPGCPVCVTPADLIDKAVRIATLPNVVLCSFGDMLRVPGTENDLLSIRAKGGDVRVVYSPLDALDLALKYTGKHVVFFAVGFETTAPTTAAAVQQAARREIDNFSLLVSHVLVPPAMELILSSPDNNVQGFLAPGHVCTVTGITVYAAIAARYGVPVVITGFEPLDILHGLELCVRRLETNRAGVDNAYARAVRTGGNPNARDAIRDVFRVVDRRWRGIGEIPQSGLALREKYTAFDAERRFEELQVDESHHSAAGVVEDERASTRCISGSILRGAGKPHECSAFLTDCTPEQPLGAPMVSSEGACAAYYRYRRNTGHTGEERQS